MSRYSTPGVYYEWLDRSPNLHGVRTDIAGFMGYAPRGPLHRAIRIESWTQYNSIFGGIAEQGFYLGYGVRGFFENGGQTCYIVRIANPTNARKAGLIFTDTAGKAIFGFAAFSDGTWAHSVKMRLEITATGQYRMTLRENDRDLETWLNLRFDVAPTDVPPADLVNSASRRDLLRELLRTNQRTINAADTGSKLIRMWLPSAYTTDDRYELEKAPRAAWNTLNVAKLIKDRRLNNLDMRGGSNGLKQVTLMHWTGEGAPGDTHWGLHALELVNDVSIIAAPDLLYEASPARVTRSPAAPDCAHPEPGVTIETGTTTTPVDQPPVFTSLQRMELRRQIVRHCERLRDRVAILDSNPLPAGGSYHALRALRREFISSYAALYYPWLSVDDPYAQPGQLIAVPPSGHMAGIYARGDLRVGVHKPPANEVLIRVQDVAIGSEPLDDRLHGLLHEAQINVIRPYNGRGIRVMGASTLADDPRLRFINVRRLLIMIAETLQQQTAWMTFEPNDVRLWSELERDVRLFMSGLWRRGMLDGATEEDAFFVRCNRDTNLPETIDQGMMICHIGLRPPYPAEFIVIRIGKTNSGITALEG